MRTFDTKSTWLKNKELNREHELVGAINVLVAVVVVITNIIIVLNKC